ncbi:MAG: gamma-glutamyl-gamma-aminobutyrate hydrolase family protein [Acidobacteria bacterium]|nr:gamma-glutamyl-gamma-aminobutyrate hydrolase family protein [Acidobacteriota bacterium]
MRALRVGITADWVARERGFNMVLERNYVSWLLDAGFQPLVLPAEPGHVETALEGVDAVLLSGGGDVLPEFYAGNPAPLPEEKFCHRDRCAFDIAVVWRAARLKMPLLGICLGCQLINVAFGGDLVRHLDDQAFRHRRPAPGRPNPAHRIRVVKGTLLDSFGVTPDTRVSSSHHQAVGRPAPGWIISALGPDDVPEAIENPQYPNILGLQWHPERTPRSPLSQSILEWFYQVASLRVEHS